MFTEAVLGGIVEAIIGYALEESELVDRVRNALLGDPAKRALAAALRQALPLVLQRYPEAEGQLFDASFLQHEGARVLAQLLGRLGGPTTGDLLAAWADGLNLSGTVRVQGVQGLTPAAEYFLTMLEREAKRQIALQEVFDRRNREQTAASAALIATHSAVGIELQESYWQSNTRWVACCENDFPSVTAPNGYRFLCAQHTRAQGKRSRRPPG